MQGACRRMPSMCSPASPPRRTADLSNDMAGESLPFFAVFLTERFRRAYNISWCPRQSPADDPRESLLLFSRFPGDCDSPWPPLSEMRKFGSRASTRTARAGESKMVVGRNSGRKDPKARCHCIGGVRTDPDAGPEWADCPDSSAGARASVGNAKMRKSDSRVVRRERRREFSETRKDVPRSWRYPAGPLPCTFEDSLRPALLRVQSSLCQKVRKSTVIPTATFPRSRPALTWAGSSLI
jgi:hypothetical protein